MKIIILMFTLATISIQNVQAQTNSTQFANNCMIHNQEYSYEYLYSMNEQRMSRLTKNNVYTCPLKQVKNFNNLRWSIVENNSEIYYLKASYFDEYLCASFNFIDIFHTRRIVRGIKINQSRNIYENCQWKIKKVNSKTSNSTYSIINAFYDEQLYAASFPFKQGSHYRQTFLWHKKDTKSNKFKWIIDCAKGKYLWI